MKNYHKLFLLTLIFAIFSCSNKDSLSPTWGDAKAKLNGQKWKAEPQAGYTNKTKKDTMFIRANVVEKDILRAELTFGAIPPNTGEYELLRYELGASVADYSKGISALYQLTDFDETRATYYLDTTQQNYFEVICFEEDTKKIEVKFDVWYKLAIKNTSDEVPESVHFTDGYIKTKVFE